MNPSLVHVPCDTEASVELRFEGLYAEYFPFVWRVLTALGVPAAALEDAAQDVFVVVHRQLPKFRAESTLRTWLFGIARRVGSNHRRSQGRRARLEAYGIPPEPWSSTVAPDQEAEAAEARRFVERFLAGLDEKKRDVFILGVLEEMSAPEVAQALGVGLNTVYSRLRRVRADFQEALALAGRERSSP